MVLLPTDDHAAHHLSARARRIVWGTLGGVTLAQGAAIYFVFPHMLENPGPVERYTFVPFGNSASWALATIVTAAYVTYAAWRSPVIRAHMLSPATWKPFIGIRVIAIPMALVTGFFEEAFFRKFLMDTAMHDGAGIALQIALSAAVFGLAHGIWGLFGGSVRSAIGPIVSTGVLGALLAIVYLIGDRSLAPCALAHIVINLLLEPWLIVTTATQGWSGKRAAS